MKSINPAIHNSKMTTDAKPPARTWNTPIAALILIVAPVAIYAQTLHADFLYWDDNVNVFQNPYLSRLTWANVTYFWQHPYEQLYIPISYTVYSLLAEAGRMAHVDKSITSVHALINPRAFHIANVCLHTLNTLLVFAILRLLTSRGASGRAFGGYAPALAGALLFAVHPLQVETVAWITEMRGLLCGFFCLAAIYAYLLAAYRESEGGPAIWRNFGYWLALVLTALALLSKPTAVALPLALFALDRWAVGRPPRSSLLGVLPWLILTIPLVVLTSHTQPVPARLDTPLWARPFIAFDALAFYLGKLLVPWNLTIDYGRRPMLVDSTWWGYVTWLAPASVAALIFAMRRRAPLLVAAGFFSLSFLLPVLGLIPFVFQDFSTVADRYVYLAMFGPALALAVLLAQVEAGASSEPSRRKAVYAVCGLVLAAFAMLAFVQASRWRDSFSLFGYALRLHPDEYEVHDDYGVAYHTAGNYDQAIAEYQQSIKLQPGFPGTYNDLGVALFEQGRVAESIMAFRQALAVDPYKDEHNATTRRNLGAALLQSGQASEACDQLLQAIEIEPANAANHSNYANALLEMGQIRDAVDEFQKALDLDPNLPEALYGLGQALCKEGRYTEAEASCRRAITIAPREPKAYDSLATVLCAQSRYDEADAVYRQAISLAPSNAQFHYNFAAGLLGSHDYADAIQEMETAISLNPSAGNYDGLGIVYVISGNKAAARAEFETVLSMDPNFPNVRGQLAGLGR